MPKTILIVDDNDITRGMLARLLRDEYTVLEAEGGAEALALLDQDGGGISAVLLDIYMPGIDGFETLRRLRAVSAFSQLPVIMVTADGDEESRVRALTLGANDFVLKPYNADIIKHCLKNNIMLRETEAAVNAFRRDRLTGLNNREVFFDEVGKLVSEGEAGRYIMACFDIDSFKVINDQYGIEMGDSVLRHIADVFRRRFEPYGGICCRVSADDFAVLYPASLADSAELRALRDEARNVEGLASPISFRIGRYLVDDISLAPSGMYDRAMLAASSIKGRYDAKIAYYDESLREKLLREQEIVTEMRQALEQRQFEVWYQPQYNHNTGALIGAEALVRWRHPQKGLVSPAVFVPIFERNGFIYTLDKFVWEEVCRLLRSELDKGNKPLPISVNISRYDLFRPDIVRVISRLAEKYGLPASLLRLEITESAFAESTDDIVRVVHDLVELGFTLEIDDFGSGYSSLNTLKSVPAQVVKLDMRFFERDDDTRRSGSIIESVIRMTKWLDMAVIAEGVEEPEQADFLKSIGCSYIQGYLYAKPMMRESYLALSDGATGEAKLRSLQKVESLDNNAFWDPKSMDTLIFNTYVGGSCIFEYCDGKIEMIRVNDKYAQSIGGEGCTTEYALNMDWDEHMDEAAAANYVRRHTPRHRNGRRRNI